MGKYRISAAKNYAMRREEYLGMFVYSKERIFLFLFHLIPLAGCLFLDLTAIIIPRKLHSVDEVMFN
jgi:hypothetical protein